MFQRFALLVLCGLVVAGCGKKSEPVVEPKQVLPFADVKVRIYSPKSIDDSRFWEIALSEWSAQTGASYEVVVYDDAEGPDALETRLKGVTGAGQVVFFPATWRSEIGARELCVPLPSEWQGFDDFNWPDLLPGVREHVLKWNGAAAFVPVHLPLMVVYYRADLLEAAGLKPPRTWDEYQQLVLTLNDWAPGLTAIEPWGAESRTSLFLARGLASAKMDGNYSVFLDYSTGAPLIDSPGFERGLEASLSLLPSLDPRSRESTADACVLEIAEGRAALAIGSAFPLLPRNVTELAAPDARIAVVPLPGSRSVYDPGRERWVELGGDKVNRVSLTGWEGLLASVASGASGTETRAAWSVLKMLTVEVGADGFAPGRMVPMRLSTSSTPYPLGVRAIDVRSHLEAVRDSFQGDVIPELSCVDREALRGPLAARLGEVLEGELSPAEALVRVREEWDAILVDARREAIRNSYARGLGFRILR